MEDCCAVCAEPLEWIAYGACGHREVCSTCTARLRVVLDDKRCCICKQDCPVVFVTKALGDYTKIVSDLSSLAAGHQNGSLWFEADIGAYFDDEDEFKRIKAMCRLQCKICEAAPTLVAGAVRPGHVFRSLDALRRHIFASHKLIMCSLCLEGRKVFIQDQKLYTKPQLDRHSSKGDSIVDGNEEERGGFTGHPMCAFCSRRFYSENELYHHMGTEHFTCHLCQRSRPGQFEYYKNYDDLESHFRNEHVLCEDPECLAKKFVVFVSEGELKVHNAKEHGGSLTRAQRNAALKIPVSYQFRRSAAQQSVGRGRGSFYRSSRGNDLNAELLSSPPTESMAPLGSDDVNSSAGCSTVASNPEHFPALAPSETVAQSSTSARESADSARWYSTALHGGSHSSLNESAFPPLPGASQPQQARQPSQRPLASLISAKGKKVKVLNAKQTRPPDGSTGNLNPNDYPELHAGNTSSAFAGRGPPLGAPGSGGGSHQLNAVPGPSSSGGGGSDVRPADADVVQLSMDEIRAATKVLIEQIRTHLKGNEEQFAKFKEAHSQFRSGETSAKSYYDQVAKLGLSVILPELVRLCPDRKKQMELLDVMRRADPEQAKNGYSSSSVGSGSRRRPSGDEGKRREKQPVEEVVEVLSTDGYRRIAGSSNSSSASGISSSSASTSGTSVLYKAKGETTGSSGWTCETCTLVNATSSTQCLACGTGKQDQASEGSSSISSSSQAVKEDAKKKKKKKVSKFVRNRLGDVEEDASISSSSATPVAAIEVPAAAATRGAWRNGGGHRLVAMTSSSSRAE